MKEIGLKHFYIPDDQSVYLLSHKDAKRLKDWFKLCESQLRKLGYANIKIIGKGAFGFAFSGRSPLGESHVFKFSRATLPQHIQDRLEEEAYMLGLVQHPSVPQLIQFQKIKRQSILVMQLAPGYDLEQYSLSQGPLPVNELVEILVQLCDILLALRQHQSNGSKKPIVHGDVKPSNLVWEPEQKILSLIDWGSCVFAQVDEHQQYVGDNVMDLMSGDLQQTNARLGDVYFIGDDQLDGKMSSPRFDEQGLASTIYALASGQSSRFGRKAITPLSLGLPQALAECLHAMMSDEARVREQGGDWLMANYHHLSRLVFAKPKPDSKICMLPTWISGTKKDIETVVYSSRKSFLRQQSGINVEDLNYLNDEQFERYYKNYLQGMGETEKGFISAVSRLGKYPVVGGLAIKWEKDGIYVDSSLKLYDPSLQVSFDRSVDNMIVLARAINRSGIFKSCMFNAKNTLHFEREDEQTPFSPLVKDNIPYDLSKKSIVENETRTHSYFEDGDDPDEFLKLPLPLIECLKELNSIHHTGCIIFEALPKHLKIHNYFTLLDHEQEATFARILKDIIALVPHIDGLGISGFMKLPYKDTRTYEYQEMMPTRFYPRNPHQLEQGQSQSA
ncbi:protein kinase [Glaciecola sp. SC05]|uniref:protein kinase domain-containing protein n=1 Tax=Glaciecola sp. SC05 TaxID=1987355 RepID=UPI003528FD8D